MYKRILIKKRKRHGGLHASCVFQWKGMIIAVKNFSTRHETAHRRILMVVSIFLGLLAWHFVSHMPGIGLVIVGPAEVFRLLYTDVFQDGRLPTDLRYSLTRIFSGFALAFVVSIPVAFLMGWYKTVRALIEPWIQFLRTIPPIALIPLVIVLMGIGESARISVIFFCSFLVMVITIFQGVTNVDLVMIKAARTFGARDIDIFFTVIIPASFPFILVAMRLGISTALTSLIASEMTGSRWGLGTMIQEAGLFFNMTRVMMGIMVIGIIGFTLDKVMLFLEKKLTYWQETKKN